MTTLASRAWTTRLADWRASSFFDDPARRRLTIGVGLSILLHAAVLVRIVDLQGSSMSSNDAVPIRVELIRAESEMRLITPDQTPTPEPGPEPNVEPVKETPAPPVPLPPPPTPSPVVEQPSPLLPTPAPEPKPVPPPVQPAAPVPASNATTGGGPPPAPPTAYHVSGTLNPPPRLLTDVDTESATVRDEGRVVVRVLISSTGEVDEVVVVSSTPRGKYDQAAIAAFSKARYSPGYLEGRAVKSQVTYEINYLPINRGSSVSGQSN